LIVFGDVWFLGGGNGGGDVDVGEIALGDIVGDAPGNFLETRAGFGLVEIERPGFGLEACFRMRGGGGDGLLTLGETLRGGITLGFVWGGGGDITLGFVGGGAPPPPPPPLLLDDGGRGGTSFGGGGESSGGGGGESNGGGGKWDGGGGESFGRGGT